VQVTSQVCQRAFHTSRYYLPAHNRCAAPAGRVSSRIVQVGSECRRRLASNVPMTNRPANEDRCCATAWPFHTTRSDRARTTLYHPRTGLGPCSDHLVPPVREIRCDPLVQNWIEDVPHRRLRRNPCERIDPQLTYVWRRVDQTVHRTVERTQRSAKHLRGCCAQNTGDSHARECTHTHPHAHTPTTQAQPRGSHK
jgi:hypothetical protein